MPTHHDGTPLWVAHADWGVAPGKRQVAVAEGGPPFHVRALGPADPAAVAAGDLPRALHAPGPHESRLLAGFDFPVGLPRAYAAAVGATFFPDLLAELGHGPWARFSDVAQTAGEISLHRPFYPMRPGGTTRAQLSDALGIDPRALRRRCEGRDAEVLFWTLGGKQVGKAALSGWRLLAAAADGTAGGGPVRLWPFHGPLRTLLGEPASSAVVVETYPREFYRYVRPDPGPGAARRAPWSKRRRSDRLEWMPRLLDWAERLGVSWESDVHRRVEQGCAEGAHGEDEFDAVVGLLGMIAVVTGAVASGEPDDDAEVATVEGWILGRRATA